MGFSNTLPLRPTYWTLVQPFGHTEEGSSITSHGERRRFKHLTNTIWHYTKPRSISHSIIKSWIEYLFTKLQKKIMINVQIMRIGSVLPHDLVQMLKYFDVTSSHWCRCQVFKCASSSFSHPVVGGKWRAGRRFDILTLSFPKFTHQRWWMKEIRAAHEIYISHQLY